MKSTNIQHTEHLVSPFDRCLKNGHRNGILWFTGLSGSGKTTLAFELERILFQKDREQIRILSGDLFHEVYIATPLEICEQRDPKGLYAKARCGEIESFTGISAPYEPPKAPDLRVETSQLSVEESLEQLIEYVVNNFTLTQ
jgi:adenylylsulfate kinase-like enzyme